MQIEDNNKDPSFNDLSPNGTIGDQTLQFSVLVNKINFYKRLHYAVCINDCNLMHIAVAENIKFIDVS